MIKNFKKMFVSVLALVFSSCCVVNMATFASGYMPPWLAHPEYFDPLFSAMPDDYCHEEDEYENFGYGCGGSFDSHRRDFARKQKKGGLPRGLQDELWKLYKRLTNQAGWTPTTTDELYVTLCQNLCYLIKTPEDYIWVNGVISSVYRHWFGRNLNENFMFAINYKLNHHLENLALSLEDINVILPLYEKVIEPIYRKPMLNFFDIMWIYSYISEKEPSPADLENLDGILRKCNIDPATFAPISQERV